MVNNDAREATSARPNPTDRVKQVLSPLNIKLLKKYTEL